MKTQYDAKVRVVAVENLRAMCARVSGVCHRYWIEKVSRSRVHVGYSNSDEYGREIPMFAVFPCYPMGDTHNSDNADNPHVVLDFLRIIGDQWCGEGWQEFNPLQECPVLWRDPSDGSWSTPEEIEEKRNPPVKIGDCYEKALVSMRDGARDMGPETKWYAYRNADLSSADIGSLQFLAVGPTCTYKSPPSKAPDTRSHGLGWRYTLEGIVDLETGKIVKAVQS